jgi:hypothetical protein
MVDLFESRLDSAGRVPVDDPRVSKALQAVVADRAAAAKAPQRRRIIPAISIGLTVALLGAGAAAASQWGPWTYVPEPDLVISRDWTDVHGNFLGSCETHFAASTLSGEKRAAVKSFLDGLDVASLEPDAESVAGDLVAVGRGDEVGDLIEGAKVSDFDITHTGPDWEDQSNARILQNGLYVTVFKLVNTELGKTWPEFQFGTLGETQCTTDPATPVAP